LEDLVSIGVLCLIEAVDPYDPEMSVQFKTFAEYRIRGAILDSVCELDGIPAHKRSKAKRVKLAVSLLEQRLGRTPSSEEVAEELGVGMIAATAARFRWRTPSPTRTAYSPRR
jgi:RNA polymerase sigma factor for flagellar operon FliA